MKIKNILASNYIQNKRISLDDIFRNPIYEQILGRKNELDIVFGNNFSEIIKSFESTVKIHSGALNL